MCSVLFAPSGRRASRHRRYLLNWYKNVLLIAFASALFHIAQSERSALCTFFSLIPKAYDEPPLVVAVFHFPGFSAAPPCRVGRLLLFSPRRAATLKKWLFMVFRLDS